MQLYPDEFVTLLAIDMIKAKGLPVMPSGLFYEHGLLFSYLASLVAFINASPTTMRYVSLVLGLITVGLTFWLARRWFSPATGLIAAMALALAPSAIHWSGRVRMYALLQLLVLLTVAFAYEGIVKNQARWRWAALLAYLGATLAHFAAIALAPPLFLASIATLWMQSRTQPTKSKKNFSFARQLPWLSFALELLALIIIVIVAFLVKRAGQPKGIEALDSTAAGAATGLVQVFDLYSDFSFNVIAGWQAISPFYFNLPALIFTPIAVLAAVVSLASLFNRIDKKFVDTLASPDARLATFFLTFILGVTTLEMVLIVSADRRDDKYLFMLLPILFLLGAHGMMLISNTVFALGNSKNSKASLPPHHQSPVSNYQSPITNYQLPIALAVILLITLTTRPAIQALLANTGDDYESAFTYVRDNWQPGDTILTGTPAAAFFYLGHNDFYSVQRAGGYDYRILTINNQPVDRWLASPAIRTEADLHQTLADNTVWLVLERWGLQREYYDLPFQQQLLAQTEYVTESQGIFVLRSKSDPHPIALEPAHPVQATLGDQVQLLGYTVEPGTPGPGQSPRLTLYWQAIAPMPQDYTVFVHLRQPEGGNVAQADHRPLGSLYPTSIWPPGEIIRETSELPLPADLSPGDYDLWTGLYLLETGERLPIRDDTSGENAVRLGGLSVK
ncbi:MAG: glycosyltransferase family 39 protein [Anaerolineae bacterium]|nr:glycosyltransferase family 39 protein [Anaerolineae bacterium]